MAEWQLERIAKALENAPDLNTQLYRTGIRDKDATDASTLASTVPYYKLNERKNLAISARFQCASDVATVFVWRGNAPVATVAQSIVTGQGSFVALGVEVYSFTACASGGPAFAGKMAADTVYFSNVGAQAIMVTLASTVASGTVDLLLRTF